MKRDHDYHQHHHRHCGECGGERWLLHNVRHKASYRLLCTHCVLSCFRGHFCPICLQVFDPIDSPPLPNQRVMCLNCPSISHLACVTSSSNSNHHFQCPSCSNPNFSFFNLQPLRGGGDKRLKPDRESADVSGSIVEGVGDDIRRSIDMESAKALVAAAKIACATMSKAANIARVEAERRVKEAALARKRAREALERVAFLTLKEKEKERERDLKLGVNGVGFVVHEQKVKPRIGSNVMDAEKFSQGVDGILSSSPKNGVSVLGGVQGEKGSNGLHSVSSVPARSNSNNQQNNYVQGS